MTVEVQWDNVILWILQVVSMLVYLGVRLWYLASGKSNRFTNGDISIPYSWMVLFADLGMSAMALYLHQKFWKQDVQYQKLTTLDIENMKKARSFQLCFELLTLSKIKDRHKGLKMAAFAS